jgi:tetratricopeptide (TPR) repeat protein
MGRVRRIVEQADTGNPANRRRDRLDDLGTAPLADIGNALDDRHGRLYNPAHSVMPDSLRDHDSTSAAAAERESRIEELLVAGLEHYFSGQHDLAISVWTRVLFLDRSHARARAYIERARGAIAERHREGEELLQTGAAAFSRGDADAARRLLTSAVERGARPEEALAMLERLDRLTPADAIDALPVVPVGTRRRLMGGTDSGTERHGIRAATLLLVLAIGLAAGVLMMNAWSSGVLPWGPAPATGPVSVRTAPEPLPVPTAAEVSLARARAWSASGRLRDALAALDGIRRGDPLRAQADELRARIQQQLLDAARATTTTTR